MNDQTGRKELDLATWVPAAPKAPDGSSSFVHTAVFGQELGSEAAFELIDAGLERRILDNFLRLFPQADDAVGRVLSLSERSLARRRGHGRLTPTESDRLYRLIELFDQASSVALRVPCAVMRGQRNVLLNPEHPEGRRVSISDPEPFLFDSRLLG